MMMLAGRDAAVLHVCRYMCCCSHISVLSAAMLQMLMMLAGCDPAVLHVCFYISRTTVAVVAAGHASSVLSAAVLQMLMMLAGRDPAVLHVCLSVCCTPAAVSAYGHTFALLSAADADDAGRQGPCRAACLRPHLPHRCCVGLRFK
jgi:hypothetical protein